MTTTPTQVPGVRIVEVVRWKIVDHHAVCSAMAFAALLVFFSFAICVDVVRTARNPQIVDSCSDPAEERLKFVLMVRDQTLIKVWCDDAVQVAPGVICAPGKDGYRCTVPPWRITTSTKFRWSTP